MELEKFEQAKNLKEKLDRLGNQKFKLELALNSSSLGATIGFSYPPSSARVGEVVLYNTHAIKEMISKELEMLKEEMDLLKEEFENI